MKYVYLVEYQELDWEPKPIHILGCLSSRQQAFALLKTLVVNKYKELEEKNNGISFFKLSVKKGKNRVYIDIDGDDWETNWRFRIVRYKIGEIAQDELIYDL